MCWAFAPWAVFLAEQDIHRMLKLLDPPLSLLERVRLLADQLVEAGGEVKLTEMDNAALLKLVSLDLARASAEG